MKKHFLLTTILLTLFCTRLTALPVGISLSTWGASKNFASGEGTHASVGAFVALAPRLEVEASAIVSLTPTIAQDLIGSLSLSFPFAAPLYYTGGGGDALLQRLHRPGLPRWLGRPPSEGGACPLSARHPLHPRGQLLHPPRTGPRLQRAL